MTDNTDADDTERHRRETVTAQGVFTRGPPAETPSEETEETEGHAGETHEATDRPSAQGVFQRGR
ncbi:hypothetical protein [Halobaculum sp. MBLA0143]|uniref:hypothetical protein n=1 Tax=Halobaculum sp. MBLA0143 TaxID=3079933 RepID=UPI003526A6E9